MPDEMLHKVDVDWLFGLYGELLTEKQRRIASLYYDEDLSLAEIAEEENVSRQCVHETLQRVEKQLRFTEEKLGIRGKTAKIESELTKALACMKQDPQKAAENIEAALRIISGEEDKNGI